MTEGTSFSGCAAQSGGGQDDKVSTVGGGKCTEVERRDRCYQTEERKRQESADQLGKERKEKEKLGRQLKGWQMQWEKELS